MAARHPRPCFHSVEVLPEFIVWSENPAGNWLQLPHFFVGELPAIGPDGLWLQADGCCSKASWVAVEVSVAGNVALARGWQTFSHACGLGRPCTLHFRYDGDATLYMRVFGGDGHRVGCFPEDSDGDEVLRLGDGHDEGEGEPAPGVDCSSSSYGGSSSGDSSSAGGYDQPPHRRVRLEGSSRVSHHNTLVKREAGSG